ncbi:MAG: T9SS type A sorting domain-containing protein [Sphingobacteriales bacterium]|nr:MAG: T9SS type A sorting domain-containing protein [Sphingobacteriales bacterium]
MRILLFALLLLPAIAAQAQMRLVGESHYYYCDDGMPTTPKYYKHNDSLSYKYSMGRGGVAGEMLNFDTARWYGIETKGIELVNDMRFFGAGNRVDSQIRHQASSDYPNPIDFNQYHIHYYTYDAQNRIVADTFYTDSLSVDNVLFSLTLYSYNTTGQPQTKLELLRNGLQWDSLLRTTYVYDAQGNNTEMRMDTTVGGVLTNYRNTQYAYNSTNQCIHRQAQYKPNLAGTIWADTNEAAFTYTTTSSIAVQYNLKYNTATLLTDTTGSITYNYNTGGLLDNTVLRKLSYTAISDSDMRTDYQYNSDGHITRMSNVYSIGNSWQPLAIIYSANTSYINNYYYETNFPASATGVSNIAQLQLYPVPATNTLYLQHNLQQAATIAISNMQGRVVMRLTITGVNTTAVNIAALPEGVYTATLYSGGGETKQGRFTIVR